MQQCGWAIRLNKNGRVPTVLLERLFVFSIDDLQQKKILLWNFVNCLLSNVAQIFKSLLKRKKKKYIFNFFAQTKVFKMYYSESRIKHF